MTPTLHIFFSCKHTGKHSAENLQGLGNRTVSPIHIVLRVRGSGGKNPTLQGLTPHLEPLLPGPHPPPGPQFPYRFSEDTSSYSPPLPLPPAVMAFECWWSSDLNLTLHIVFYPYNILKLESLHKNPIGSFLSKKSGFAALALYHSFCRGVYYSCPFIGSESLGSPAPRPALAGLTPVTCPGPVPAGVWRSLQRSRIHSFLLSEWSFDC